MNTTYPGINYGPMSNIDPKTGIRYGVIPGRMLNPEALDDIYAKGDDLDRAAWQEEIESRIRKALSGFVADHTIDHLVAEVFDLEEYEADGPMRMFYSEDGYVIQTDSDGDVWVLKSPFVSNARYCSPCAPGAGFLANPCETGPLCYCLGPEWFDGENPMPYVSRPAPSFQVYRDSGDGVLDLSGCWGSEHAKFNNLADAEEAAAKLAQTYPACAWVVADQDMFELFRIPAKG